MGLSRTEKQRWMEVIGLSFVLDSFFVGVVSLEGKAHLAIFAIAGILSMVVKGRRQT